jgi:hypothetical protein
VLIACARGGIVRDPATEHAWAIASPHFFVAFAAALFFFGTGTARAAFFALAATAAANAVTFALAAFRFFRVLCVFATVIPMALFGFRR